ncbi:MAG TPA: ABC transporter ATP-binding protein [Tepidisphaeraceae bacterium]|nr:ABC transporter ATP-binding protein [Tepidisphaeraceae bacterium]
MNALTASPLAIDLHAVTKIYKGKVTALSDISMRVQRGEVFGLLGPNGAGKSTLVKIMMGIVYPTQARGLILDHAVGHKPTLRRVGYLPENHRFPRYLTGRQVLEFFAALSKVDRRARKLRAGKLLERVGMAGWGERKISSYSKGMMQRIGIAQAMMNDPDLLVLDEPTDGVDPVGRREIRDVLLELKGQGKTVFINSHLLSELEMICDRVAILVRGQVARQGTLDELSTARLRYELEVIAEDPSNLRSRLMSAVGGEGWLPPRAGTTGGTPIDRGRLAGGQWVEIDGPVVRVGITEAAEMQPLVDAVRSAGFGLRRLQPVRPTLEELFLETVGGTAGAHNVGAK